MVIAIVGVTTALFAATIAVAQNDIKKVLAYSTVSQLGYMFLAVGSGAYVAAIFHMITHAFFKALLFLGSGSVIHGMHHEQDMRKMGALRKLLPITAGTFIVGVVFFNDPSSFLRYLGLSLIIAGVAALKIAS
jgi:NADH-quinone oxidoreductase subunit L